MEKNYMAILIFRPMQWIVGKDKYNILLTIKENPDVRWRKLRDFFSDELLFKDTFTTLKNKGYVEIKFNVVNLTPNGTAHLEVLLYCYTKIKHPPEYLLFPQEKIMWMLTNNPYCKWSNLKQLKGISGRTLHSIMTENFKNYHYIKKANLHGVKVYQLTRKGKRVFSKYLHTVKTEGYWIKQDKIEEHIKDIQNHIDLFIFSPFKLYRSSDFLKFRETLKCIEKAQKTFTKVEKRLRKLRKKLSSITTLRKGTKYKIVEGANLSEFLE